MVEKICSAHSSQEAERKREGRKGWRTRHVLGGQATGTYFLQISHTAYSFHHLLIMPSNYGLINGLIPLIGVNSPQDLITPQEPHLRTLLRCGPDLQHMSLVGNISDPDHNRMIPSGLLWDQMFWLKTRGPYELSAGTRLTGTITTDWMRTEDLKFMQTISYSGLYKVHRAHSAGFPQEL